MHKETIDAALLQKYEEVIDLSELDELERLSAGGLQEVFLMGVSDAYLASPLKVMLVGKETRSWNQGLKQLRQAANKTGYIQRSMTLQANILADRPRSSKFFQFYRQAHSFLFPQQTAAPTAIAWGNLFCQSYRRTSPRHCPAVFEQVCALSQRILQAQIEVLQPHVVLFVTGAPNDHVLKQYFPVREQSIALVKRRLWSFKTDQFHAFRTNHPQWGGGQPYRLQALQLIRSMHSQADQG